MATWVLGYDSFRVDDQVQQLDSPPLARAAFDFGIAKAKKSRSKKAKPVDETPAGPQADRDAKGRPTRVWLTAVETHDKVKHRFASEQLAALDHGALVEVSIGLQQWNDSHKATFDPVLDVLAKLPKLTALAFGDYDNRGGHIIKLPSSARILALYPALERLRVTATNVEAEALDQPWTALRSLALRGRIKGDWKWLLSGKQTPKLEHLGIPVELVPQLAKSALVKQLKRVSVYGGDAKLAGVEVTVVEPIDRYRSSWE